MIHYISSYLPLPQVKDIVQKASEDKDYTLDSVLSTELQAIWDTYDETMDSDCADHQYGVG